MSEKFINALEKEVSSEQLQTSPEARHAYSLDATRNAQLPLAVLFPEGTRQLQEVMRLCNEHKVAVTPRGSGTGLSGGAVPSADCLLVSFTKMNNLKEVDNINHLAVVEPGVITNDLQTTVLKQNLFYPPDPSSANISTLGGNIAEGAGGCRALKYGVTRDYVMGLEVVLPDGSIINTGGTTYKNVSGLDLTRLMVASEGTLGLITEATLKLLPAPNESATYLLTFKTLEKASRAVIEIIASSILPTALEVMDKVTIDAVRKFSNVKIDDKAGALILLELDGEDVSAQRKKVDKVLNRIKPNEITKTTDALKAKELWAARKAALPALSRIAPNVLLEDATVPRSELVSLIKGVQKIAKNNKLVIGCFGHAGDGNLHPTIVTDLRDAKQSKRVEKATDEIFELALKLGGTLSGEHGIGIVKKKYLENEIGEKNIKLMKAIKTVFDTGNILNPDKIFGEGK